MANSPLKDVLAKAAEILGEPIARVIIECESGSRVRIVGTGTVEPSSSAKPSERDRRIAALKPRVVEWMRVKDMGVSRKQIAKGLGYPACTSYLSGAINSLLSDAVLVAEMDEDGDEIIVVNDAAS